MQTQTIFTIQASPDLVIAITTGSLMAALAFALIVCAVISLRRPISIKGRRAVAAMLFVFSCAIAIVALIFLADIIEIRQHRVALAAGHFTELHGIVTATRSVPFTKHNSPEFLLHHHWFFVPDPLIGHCAPRPGDELIVDYAPADSTNLADTVLRVRSTRACSL